jgi:hypothetical protein
LSSDEGRVKLSPFLASLTEATLLALIDAAVLPVKQSLA